MIKKILLATDLAEKTDRAMERALKIAHEHKAKLYIIHIAPAYSGLNDNKKWAMELQKNTEDMIKRYLNDYVDFTNIQTEVIVRQGGEIFFQILEAAYTHKVDLIVTGMHGKKKFRDFFAGTTVERLMRTGVKPILIVKDKPAGPYKNILSAVDYSLASRTALRTAMALAPHATFNVIHIYNVPVYFADAGFYIDTKIETEKEQKKMFNAFLKTEQSYFTKEHNGKNSQLTGKILEGALYDTLMKKAKNLKADIITLGTHSKSQWDNVMGSTVADILSNPPCDVLVASEKFHE